MDDLLIQRRMRMPVVTGVPTSPEAVRSSQPQTGTSFREVLEQEAQKTTELSFSRHAAGRVAERGIEISRTGMERLEEGLRMAGKGPERYPDPDGWFGIHCQCAERHGDYRHAQSGTERQSVYKY